MLMAVCTCEMGWIVLNDHNDPNELDEFRNNIVPKF